MEEYSALHQTCDNILNLFSEARLQILHREIITLLGRSISERGDTDPALNKLRVDGHLELKQDVVYHITGRGITFRDSGGYHNQISELNKKKQEDLNHRELETKVYQSSINTNESVIKTNASVISTNELVKENTESQKKLTKLALVIALISAFGTIAPVIKDVFHPDTNSIELNPSSESLINDILKNQKVILEQQKKILDSLTNESHRNVKSKQ